MSAFVNSTSFSGLALRNAATRPPAVSRSNPVTTTPSRSRRVQFSPASTRLAPRASVTADLIANRSFQLEEDEDSLSCTSAIYLQDDGHLTIGRTDGPRPDKVDATWTFNPSDGEIVMDIQRFFNNDATDGKVSFCVRRVLRGHLDTTRKNLADLPAFTGAMYQHPADYSKHSEVGWWAMILAVDDLPSTDFDISSS